MRYPFQCTVCGRQFEVSRPARDSAADATCPTDSAAAVRIFLAPAMNFGRPPAATTPGPPARGYSHHGHSHGPGTGSHSH
jgi:putative FmdB family regulatory protein